MTKEEITFGERVRAHTIEGMIDGERIDSVRLRAIESVGEPAFGRLSWHRAAP